MMRMTVEQAVNEVLDEGQVVSEIRVIDIQEWSEWIPDHDGLDSCSQVALVTLVTGEHDGMPLERVSGRIAGWWEPFMG